MLVCSCEKIGINGCFCAHFGVLSKNHCTESERGDKRLDGFRLSHTQWGKCPQLWPNITKIVPKLLKFAKYRQ